MEINKYHSKNDIQSVRSRLKEIRHDNKNCLVPFGELLDNSKDWGKCSISNINLRKDKIIVSDNGIGIKRKRLIDVLKFGKENINVAKGRIGKFGLGLKKGSIILANKVTILTKTLTGDYMKCEADWGDMVEKNNYRPIIEKMSQSQINYFTQNFDTGTIIILENLLEKVKIDELFYNNLIYYCKSLYKNMENYRIIIEYEKKKKIIDKFIDPTFYNFEEHENKIKYKVKIYEKSNGIKYSIIYDIKSNPYIITIIEKKNNFAYKLKKYIIQIEDKLLYEFHIYGTILSQNFLNKEKKEFSELGWKDKRGFYFYRQGRNLNGFYGLKCNLDSYQGMYRSKGVRIIIEFPSCVDDMFFVYLL